MKVKQIYYTSYFTKKFKKIPQNIKNLAVKREKLFRKDPSDTSLKTRALAGKLKSYYSFSINYHYRIMFKLEKNGDVTFVDVGTHSIYK